LDAALGRPAAGVAVSVSTPDGAEHTGVTDSDGRVAQLLPGPLAAGTHRLRFDTAGYWASVGQHGFYPEVVISFTVTDGAGHHHVPLLLSPYSYSTYRGS
jgi:5-hydroxyisourate hydrolase